MSIRNWTTRRLTDECVYWGPPVRDGLGGYTWTEPKELMSFWELSLRSRGPEINYNPTGAVVAAMTTVWVPDTVELGGYLYRGTIISLDSYFEPNPPFDEDRYTTEHIYEVAAQIVSVEVNKSIINNGIVLTKAMLDGR